MLNEAKEKVNDGKLDVNKNEENKTISSHASVKLVFGTTETTDNKVKQEAKNISESKVIKTNEK